MKNTTTLKENYTKACNAYLKAFCDQYEYDYDPDCWVGNDPGTIAEVGDLYVGMDTIRTAVDRNIPEREFYDWYYYCLRCGMIGIEGTPNFDSWLQGCPRKSMDELKSLESLHNRAEQAKQELVDAIEAGKLSQR